MASNEKVGSRLKEILLKPFTFYITHERIFLVAVKKPNKETSEEATQLTTTLVTSSTIPSPTKEDKNKIKVNMVIVFKNVFNTIEKNLESANIFAVTAFFLVSTISVIFKSVFESTFKTEELVNGPSNIARNTSLEVDKVVL